MTHITTYTETVCGVVPMYFEDIPDEIFVKLKKQLYKYQVKRK